MSSLSDLLENLPQRLHSKGYEIGEGISNYLEGQPIADLMGFIKKPSKKTLSQLFDRVGKDASSFNKAITGGDPQAVEEFAFGMGTPMATIKAFHGSPYKFKKFTDEAIGTGEGAQAFGHGHYFQGKGLKGENAAYYGKHLAETKAKKLYNGNLIENIKGDEGALLSQLQMDMGMGKTFNESKKKLTEYLHSNNEDVMVQKLDKIRESNFSDFVPTSYQYKTHLFPGKKPSQYDLLEWDKPVSDKLRNKIKKVLPKGSKIEGDKIIRPMQGGAYHVEYSIKNGGDLHEAFAQMFREKGASKKLSEAGIGGIKYPSGTLSGIKDSPYSNYVIFDPNDIKIKKRTPIK